jgi:hypothetical protein
MYHLPLFVEKGYKGYVQSDAFSGYNHLADQSDIQQLGCWAHARRHCVKVVDVKKKIRSKHNP